MNPPPRVLIIEDEESIALLQRYTLEEAGFEVEEARLGQRALEILERQNDFALVILDYRLPDMTGADIVSTLGNRIEQMQVAVVTGYPDRAIEAQMRRAGVVEYIIKDSRLEFLDQMLAAAKAAVSRAPGVGETASTR